MVSALLIDDDRGLVESLTAAAEAHGIELRAAYSWDDGLALFHILSPDLVIADYDLPGSRHGLQLLAEIRRLRPTVRLVLVSGKIDPGDLQKAEALSLVDRVLSKGSALESTKAILEEAEAAQASSQCPTNWKQFARAYLNASSVSEVDLKTLDDVLRAQIEER